MYQLSVPLKKVPHSVLKDVDVYIDGSSNVHSVKKEGGWAIVAAINSSKGIVSKTFGGNSLNTTNNRMELTSFIECFNNIQFRDNFCFNIYTDSMYVINSLNNTESKVKKESTPNKDLLFKLIDVLGGYHICLLYTSDAADE